MPNRKLSKIALLTVAGLKVVKIKKFQIQEFFEKGIYKNSRVPKNCQIRMIYLHFLRPLCILIDFIQIIWHNTRIYIQIRSSNRWLKIPKCQSHNWNFVGNDLFAPQYQAWAEFTLEQIKSTTSAILISR